MSTPLLYKYGRLGEHAESFFTEPALWFATPQSLNDPFEIRPVHTINGNPLPEDMSADLNESLGSLVGVCCMSKCNDSILMWSHYADSHAGFCVGFDAGGIAKVADQTLDVQYADIYPALEFLGINLDRPHEKWATQHMAAKFSGWAYEQEVRLLSFKHPSVGYRFSPDLVAHGPGLQRYPPELLRTVTFGLRMKPCDRARIRAWVTSRGHEVEFFECLAAQESFRIEVSSLK